MHSRLRVVLDAAGETPATDPTALWTQAEALLAGADPELVWLARSVLGGMLPDNDEMELLLRTTRLFGPRAALRPVVDGLSVADADVAVRVVRGATTCDVHNTASSGFTSGIQRVVRAVAERWARQHDLEFLVWDRSQRSMRALDEDQRSLMFGAEQVPGGATRPVTTEVVVPWRGTHLVPEVFVDPARTARTFALAKYSGSQVGVIGYDCIPMTTASSVAPGMTAAFGTYLAACRQSDRVAAISGAAAGEYRGWRQMLAGVRQQGPEIAAIDLPVAARPATREALEHVGWRLGMTEAPMVLVVGSHEPRKNHLAVLHAAESLWREGQRFTLVIAGAGSWRAEAYHAVVADLQAAGRPVQSISGLSDDLLWAAYERAHCTLFPSLNEGFGLPVAESLAAGTPVITSDFGSTRDIVAPHGEPWGGLLVDPHDDDDIADALRVLLTEPDTYQRLRREISRHDLGSWDDYADRVWRFLVDGSDDGAERSVAASHDA